MKLNVSKRTVALLSRYYTASTAHNGHSTAKYLRFGLNLFLKPEASCYYPEFIKVEISTACNMSCSFCGAAKHRAYSSAVSGKHMPMHTLKKIVDNVPTVRWIDLQGVGEPMLHPQFGEILSFLNSRGISIQFTTNGTLLKDGLAEALLSSGIHLITVSLSAADCNKYFAIHGADNFNLVVNNLRSIVSRKKNGMPKIRILSVILATNLDDLKGLINLAKALEVDSLVFSAYKEISDNDQNIPDSDSLCKAVRDASIYAHQLEMPLEIEIPIIDIDTPLVDRGISSPRCLWPWTSLAVNVQGDVIPCCYTMGQEKYALGSLAEESIYSVYNSLNYKSFRLALNTGETKHLTCHFCNDHVW